MDEPKPLDKLSGRWADEDLNLEYAYEAIEDKKLKEHCMSLWFENKRIKSAVEWLKEKFCLCENMDGKCPYCDTIDEAFPDVNTINRIKRVKENESTNSM